MKKEQNSTEGIEELKEQIKNLKSELASAKEQLTEFIKNEQKSNESSLNKEAHIQSIFSAAPLGIGVLIDREFRVVNDSFCEMVGYSLDEIIGKNARFLYVDEEEYNRVGEEKYNQISKFGKGSVESQFKRKDGKIIDIFLSSSPIDYNDLSRGVTFTVLDITERKRIEKAIKESETKFRSIFEDHTAVKLLLDAENGNIVDANHSASKFYGYTIEELKGMNISHINKLSKQQINEAIENAKTNKKNYFQFKHWLSNGEVRDVEVYSSPVEFNNKQYLHSIIHDITEEKLAVIELQKLSLATEQSPVIVLITDIEGNIEYINPKFTQVTGYSFEEVVGKNPRLLNSGMQSKEHYKDLWDTILAGKTWSGELNNKTKDGKLYWESASISPIRNEEDEITHFVAVKEDITYEREQEKRLRKSEYLLNETQAMSKVGGWEYKISDKRMIWTNEVFKIFGITTEKVVTPNLGLQYYHEDDRPKIKEAFSKCVKEGIPYDLELRFINANKKEFWIRTSGKPIFVDGKVYKVVGNFADITSRKINEIELSKLSQATEQSSASIVITNLKGDIEYVNPKFTEVTGYTFNEAFGKNPRVLKSEKQPLEYYKNLWDTITSGNVWKGEFHNKKKNGQLFWESASISPIKNKEGIVTHFVAVKEDISEKREMLNEIIKAKEKAENADKMKSIFLAQMSHEIRTPINTLVSSASLLRYDMQENAEEDQLRTFDILDSAGARIIRTVDLLINLSEIQAGTYEPSPDKINVLGDILAVIVSNNKKLAASKNIELYMSSTTDDTNIIADSYTVHQIFLQLIDNAIKYTSKGEIRINIRKNTKEQLIVEVEDTGVGISEEYLAKLFEPFTQEEMGYTRKYEGNGIGLSLVKTYCDLNGAKIEVESEKGIGSTFRVIFN